MHFQNVILKARQLGFTTFIQIFMLDACLFNSNVRAGTVAHTLGDAKTIFRDKIKYPYDNLPEQIKRLRPVLKDSADELMFSNNSSIRVGTSLRSGTLQYLHVSEYGKLCAKYPEKAREVRTGALNTIQSGQIVFIESTAEGQEGHFHEISESAQSKQRQKTQLSPLDFKFHFYPWWKASEYQIDPNGVEITQSFQEYFLKLDTESGIKLSPAQKAWYVKKYETQKEDMKREYPSTPKEAFEASVEGAYYSEQLARMETEQRIAPIPVDRIEPVYTAWDIGFNDSCSIWFIQRVGLQYRLIDYYENSGYGFDHYAEILRKKREDRGWHYGEHYLPHDIASHEISNGQSRLQTLETLRVSPVIAVQRHDVNDGINATRRMLDKSWIDPVFAEQGLKCLRNYRKEWDEEHSIYRNKPLHNWASHGADALRTFAAGYAEPSIINSDRKKYKKSAASSGLTHMSA